MGGELLVLVFVNVLDVEHHQIRDFKQAIEPLGVVRGKGDSGGVDTGVNSLLLSLLEKLGQKFDLQQGFAARDGDSSVSVERPIFLVLSQKLVNGHFGSFSELPRVRVVAVETPHGTTLKEDHESESRTIDCTKTFGRMDVTRHGDQI